MLYPMYQKGELHRLKLTQKELRMCSFIRYSSPYRFWHERDLDLLAEARTRLADGDIITPAVVDMIEQRFEERLTKMQRLRRVLDDFLPDDLMLNFLYLGFSDAKTTEYHLALKSSPDVLTYFYEQVRVKYIDHSLTKKDVRLAMKCTYAHFAPKATEPSAD